MTGLPWLLRVIEADCITPLRVAVTVADWAAVMVPAVARKVAAVEPAGMLTDPGTDSTPELLPSATTAPVPVALESATVQVALPLELNDAGAQPSEVSTAGAVRVIVAGCALPL